MVFNTMQIVKALCNKREGYIQYRATSRGEMLIRKVDHKGTKSTKQKESQQLEEIIFFF
uniref:Uncharacterized protein n=1 Tax=Rhizophora mucronata TaxID=61149 RepID=A0A2P2K1W4_RHIMU